VSDLSFAFFHCIIILLEYHQNTGLTCNPISVGFGFFVFFLKGDLGALNSKI
jgi:hypothetical protein